MLRTLTLLACGAGLLLLLAGHFAKVAFVSGALREGRDVSIGRHVSHGGYSHAKFRKEIRQLDDEQLHDMISESRKMMLHHRLEKFRRKKPSAGSKYEWQYKIALAKTFLKERELAAMTTEEEVAPIEPLSKDFPNRPTLAEEMKTEDLEMARTEWWDIGGWGSKPLNQKSDFDRAWGFEKQYYRKQGKPYENRTTPVQSGWSWDPSKSKRNTNLPLDAWNPHRNHKRKNFQVRFNPDNVEIKKQRKAAAKESATSTEAFASEKAHVPRTSGLFVGAAFLGLAAIRGRRF